eukprot:TRINITY_DN24450_c0_g1_i1.p2 TRINITY_DN24450_c0_g1~~TRINITY_DN24450_c0_g1_i1.p2  ORF type:complete len:110 (-),score=3.13 TRINITY_DN24450_c0_g1_i1:54-344(-)
MGPKARNRMTNAEQRRVNERLSKQKAHKRKVQNDHRKARGLEPDQEARGTRKEGEGKVVSGSRRAKRAARGDGKIEIFRLEGHCKSGSQTPMSPFL